MVGIASAIAARFPNAKPPFDWGVLFNGTADEIYRWDVAAMGRPMPSEAELAEWMALPAPPAPDWAAFKGGLLTSAAVAQVMGAAREAGCEPAVTNLPVALEKAQSGNVAEFAACWGLVVAAGGASPETVAELVAAAEACNLPADFVSALSPE